ncbi:Arf GTPase activating protein, partial [Meredithblackwellia eburnea MCA 4105]
RLLLELTKLPGNDVCADCRARNPRWAGWDHGVFLCTECAGLHRKMGTHVSKVKSLTFDTWTRDQVDVRTFPVNYIDSYHADDILH